mgnify:CR=1 FL=1
MNKTKRNLELAAAIMSIVFGTILLLGGIVLIQGVNAIISNPTQYGYTEDQIPAFELVKTSSIIVILIAIALIIVASLLCPAPKVDSRTGTIKNRRGLGITISIMTGIMALMELSGNQVLYGLLIAIPCVLMIVSLCMKHGPNVEVTLSQATNTYAPGNMFNPHVDNEPKPAETNTIENSNDDVKPQ